MSARAAALAGSGTPSHRHAAPELPAAQRQAELGDAPTGARALEPPAQPAIVGSHREQPHGVADDFRLIHPATVSEFDVSDRISEVSTTTSTGKSSSVQQLRPDESNSPKTPGFRPRRVSARMSKMNEAVPSTVALRPAARNRNRPCVPTLYEIDSKMQPDQAPGNNIYVSGTPCHFQFISPSLLGAGYQQDAETGWQDPFP